MGSLILLIAVILIFKTLFSNFGFTSTEERKKEEEAINEFLKQKFANSNEIKNVYVIDLVNKKSNSEKNNSIEELANETLKKESSEQMKELFLKQVEKVVEEVVRDFAEGRKEPLKELLTNKMFETFSNEIDNNLKNKLLLKSVIVSFDDKKILNDFNYNSENVSIALTMKQINYIEDENGNIMHGSKDDYVIIKEIWTFVKNNNREISSPWFVDSISEYKN